MRRRSFDWSINSRGSSEYCISMTQGHIHRKPTHWHPFGTHFQVINAELLRTFFYSVNCDKVVVKEKSYDLRDHGLLEGVE